MTISSDGSCLYVIYIDGSVYIKRIGHQSFVLSGFTSNTAYTISVTATNLSGTSVASSASTSLTPTKFTSFAPTAYSDVSGVYNGVYGGYKIYTFTGSSTYTIPYDCSNSQQLYVFVVGGGGAGGVDQGGGGGAGGYYQTIKTGSFASRVAETVT